MRSNGDVERAELEALKAAPIDEKLDYVVTCAFKTKRAVDAIPVLIADAIEEQRRKDTRRVAIIASSIGAVCGIVTPFVLHFL